MASNVRDSRLQLIAYDGAGSPTIAKDAILVLQTMTPWSIFPGLRVADDTHVLFWTFHPFNLVPTVPVLSRLIQHGPRIGPLVFKGALPLHRRQLRRFLDLLLVKDAIVFMDSATVENTSDYLQKRIRDPLLVPIVAPDVRNDFRNRQSGEDAVLRVGWVGRIADFKYPILTFALDRLNAISPRLSKRVRVDIVGSGDFLPSLKADAEKWKGLEVRFLGEKRPEDVLAFLESSVDLLLAMGTSALEGGAFGIPTILLDFSYSQVPHDYRFRWLHQQTDHSLGAFIGPRHRGTGSDEDLLQMIQSVISDREELRTTAERYVAHNHSIDLVVTRLEMALRRTMLTWRDLARNGLLQKGLVYRGYRLFKRISARSQRQ